VSEPSVVVVVGAAVVVVVGAVVVVVAAVVVVVVSAAVVVVAASPAVDVVELSSLDELQPAAMSTSASDAPSTTRILKVTLPGLNEPSHATLRGVCEIGARLDSGVRQLPGDAEEPTSRGETLEIVVAGVVEFELAAEQLVMH
jgi:hypothetical protein